MASVMARWSLTINIQLAGRVLKNGCMNTDEAIQVLRRKHLGLATERSYCAWLRRYCDCLKGLPSHLSSQQKPEHFLTRLAKNGVAASTQNQAFNATIFFYNRGISFAYSI
jgi:hypothetical protein